MSSFSLRIIQPHCHREHFSKCFFFFTAIRQVQSMLRKMIICIIVAICCDNHNAL